jgi:hypothetical protein
MFDGRCNRFENTLPVTHHVMIVPREIRLQANG